MYQDIEYTLDKHVAIITLNRPDRLNAWTGQMEAEIRAAMTAAAADDGLRVWKVGNTTAAAAEELSSTSDIRVIEFGPGPAIATADAAGQVALWRFADARWRSIDLTVDPEAPGIPGDLLGGVPGNLRFSADGRWLAASSSSAEVGLWQLHAEKAQRRVTHGHTRAVLDLAIGGDRFATVSWDGTTRLGTLPESDPIAAGAIPTAVSFSPDGSRIVTACEDKVARVYSAQDGHLVAELEGHLKAVTAATFGFGNDRVFTVSEDGTAMFFDVATRKRDTELDVLDRVVRATYSRDGVYLLTVHDQERGQEIRIWTPSRPIPTDGGTRLAGKELLELYCSRTSQKLPTDPQPER